MKPVDAVSVLALLCAGCGEEAAPADPRRAIRVSDPTGRFAAGIEVRHLSHAQWLGSDPPLSTRYPEPWSAALAEGAACQSDVEGRAFVEMAVGYVVATDGELFATATVSREGDAPLELVLAPPRRISLRVLRDDGSAAASVPVALHQGAYVEGRLGPEVWRWRTGGDGTVQAAFLPAESRRSPLTAAVVLPGLSVAVTVGVDASDEVALQLPPVGALEVRLEGGPEPPSPPELTLARPPVGPGFPRSWPDPEPTEDPRRFRFWPVPLGLDVRVAGDRRHFDPAVVEGPTAAGATASVTLRARDK